MTGKIKVALCLSGEPRYSMVCFPYIYESFINLKLDFDVDVFTHSRINFRALNNYNPISHYYDTQSKSKIINHISQIQLPPELEESKVFYNAYTEQTNLIVNPFLMFDAIQKCTNAALNHDKYDIIIRSRYDFITESELNIIPIIRDILSKKYNLFIPQKVILSKAGYDDIKEEYSDQLAIGDSNSMEYYSNLLNNLPQILNKTKSWKSEKWLYEHITQSEFKVSQFPLSLPLLRSIQIESTKGNPDFYFYNI